MEKKFNALIKAFLPIGLLCLSIALLNNSCSEDFRDDPPTGERLISEARSFFENEVLNEGLNQGNDNNLRHKLSKSPNWDKAQVKRISIGNAVFVPIRYAEEFLVGYEEDKHRIALDKTSYLMIYKDKKEKMRAEWVTLYRKDDESKANNKFVGSVVIEDWNGTFRRGFAVGSEGQTYPIEPSGTSIYRKAAYSRATTCFTIVRGGGTVSVGGYEGAPQYWYEIYCFSSGGGGGGGEGTEKTYKEDDGGGSTGDYTLIYDCNGDLFGSAYVDEDCGCLGGNTGMLSCAAKKIEFTDSLKINFPCFKNKVFTKLELDTAFKKLLAPFAPTSGEVPNLKYTYSSQIYGSGGKYQLGQTATDAWHSTVSLNSASLTHSSELFIAMAAIHETGHAYANYYIKAGYYNRPVIGSSWAINIADYELANRESNNYSNAMDHSIFLEQYYDKMVDVIATYGGSNYTMEQYRMAALYGLDNPGPPPTDPALLTRYNQLSSALSSSYSKIIAKYNINLTTLNNFKLDNLVNVSTSLKLPTNCP